MGVWWKGNFRDFTPEKRQRIADILDGASGTIEKGTPIRQQIRDIIQLLLPPQFVSLCNDILELWMNSSNENEALMDDLGLCGRTWAEAEGRGRRGSLTIQKAKNIFAVLLEVVHTLEKDPDMKINIRMQYVVDFIKSVRTDLERRTTLKHPENVFTYVKDVMTTYAPPNAPPANDIGTVAEERDEEEETAHGDYGLYLDIEQKLWKVYRELRESAWKQTISANNGKCFEFVQKAMDEWPGDVKFFTEDVRREIAAILGQAQETLNTAEGTPIWVQLQAIIELLVPLIVSDDAVRGGDGNDIPMEADVSTLLRQMKQLCA
jgi:hypothetical protein